MTNVYRNQNRKNVIFLTGDFPGSTGSLFRFLFLLVIVLFLSSVPTIVRAQCEADAGPDVTICQGESVVIGGNPTAIDAGGGVDYDWNNASSLNDDELANPTASPNVTTTYTIELSGGGCGGEEDEMTVTVLPAPNATFTASPLNQCADIPVVFDNNTTACPSCDYTWDFDDGNTSTQSNPTYQFDAPGGGTETYSVVLTAEAANGCTDTYTLNVTVDELPDPVLLDPINDFQQCTGDPDFPITVFDASTPATNASYTIDWGDGTADWTGSTAPQGVSHPYAGIGVYDITYTIVGNNGCSNSVTIPVFNVTNPGVGAGSQGSTQDCGPVEFCFNIFNFDNNHESTTYTIDFGDGSPILNVVHPPAPQYCHTYTLPSCPGGSYTFTITATNGCDQSIATVAPVKVGTPPVAAFSATPQPACVNSTVTFINQTIPGYSFTNCSTNAVYTWNFGDPGSGALNTATSVSAANQSHVYANPGTYTVTMSVQNPCGTSTVTQEVCIETAPTPQFTVNTNLGCNPLTVITNNTSNNGIPCSVNTGWLVNYSDLPCDPDNGSYSFTGGTNAGSLSPQFLLSSVGTYTLTLQMSNSCGIFNDSEVITVNTVPVVAVNPLTAICAGSSVTPSALVDGCNLPITSYAWNFTGGSPTSSSNANPGSVTYANAGNYSVGLTVTNACGPSTSSTPLLVNPIPNVNITTTDIDSTICDNTNLVLTATGANSYTWTSSQGIISTTATTATVSPDNTQTYTVTGFIGSCSDVGSITIDVLTLPSVNPSGTFAMCVGETEQLGLTVTGGSGTYSSYSWSPSASLNFNNIPNPISNAGSSTNYTVQVTDDMGCVGSGIVPLTVNALPVVNAGLDLVLCDQAVGEQLTGQSPTSGGIGVWSGPNITAGGVFTPSGTGVFVVTYTFTNSVTGCVNSDTRTITVVAPTTADAGPDHEYCVGAVNQTLVPVTPGGTWSGNNVTSGGSYTPSTVGTFPLYYTLGVGSCQTQDTISVTVNPLPVPNAGPNLTICAGDTIPINGSVSGGELPYTTPQWTNGATLSAINILNPLAFPSVNTTYTLLITDNNGCQGSDQVAITVNSAPVVNAGPDISLCDQPIGNQLTGFSPTSGGIGAWTGPNVNGTGLFTPNGEGMFTLYYTFTNANGCDNVDSLVVTVVSATPANAGPDDNICLNAPAIQLLAGGTWSGSPQVTSGGLFTPSVLGPHNLTYTIGVGTCLTSDQMTITVLPLPTANAGVDQTVCAGDLVQFDGGGSSQNGPITLYTWSGGTVSNTQIEDPTGTYNITTTLNLTIVDSEGCSDPDQVTIFVNQLPIVNAGNDLVLCDQPIVETLVGYSPIAGGSGTWSGPGVTSNGQFTSPGVGVYTLYYDFTNNNTCHDNDSITVTVLSPVVADAGPDVDICLNNGIYQLTGFTPAAGGTWSGTGIVNASAGTFNPMTSGVGTFELTIQNGSGTCYTDDSLFITVLPLPNVVAGPNESVCGNAAPFNLQNFIPASGGTWSGGGITDAALGTFDPGVGTGVYNLTYSYTDPITGCTQTSTKTVTVNPVPIANFILAPLGCTNAPVDIINTTVGGLNYNWDYGNSDSATGYDPVYTYPAEGVFDVTLIVTNQFLCADTALNAHEVIAPPQAILALDPANGCAPLDVNFINNSIGQQLTWNWNLSIGTSIAFEPGIYTYQQGADDLDYPISLTATNFCGSDTDTDIVTVFPQPVAGFGTNLDVDCSPFEVVFNNTSVGNPDTFLWDFGDNTTSSVEEPGEHIFFADSVAVDYTITLILSNECGIDTADYTITVLPNVVTAFFNTNVTEGCSPLTVEFTDYSENGTIVQYDFGDESFSGAWSPTHTFLEDGIYTVYQYINDGCSFDTASIVIEVFPSPVIDFDIDAENLCANTPVQFIPEPGDAINLFWDFGDGTTSDLSNPIHQYDDGGNYIVELTGTSWNGCSTTVSHPFTAYDAPQADFSIPEQVGCAPFTVSVSNGTNGGMFYSWDFGDTNTSNSNEASNTYYNTGTDPELYTITLIAQNLQLCADTFEMTVIVAPQPTSAFALSSFESCYFPQEVAATNFSLNGNGYNWYLDGQLYSTLYQPVFDFPVVGEYEVELVVTNQFGCTHSSFADYVIHPLPVLGLDASPLDGCVDLTVNFNNLSQGAQGYLWDFGDGSTSEAQNPMHIYDDPGLYDISLIATTDMGCSDSLTVEDYVEAYNLPVADFDIQPKVTTLYEPVVTFFDDSFDASAWLWEFGDGGTAQQPNVEHTYANTGFFPITLTVWNEHGCVDDKNDVVIIEDLFNFYAPNAFTPDGDDLNDYWKPSISGTAFLNDYHLQIFDRWGTIIFETHDTEEAWVGDVRGGEHFAKDDAYNWLVRLHLKGSDEERIFKGHIILVR